jgi:hypothetical protein
MKMMKKKISAVLFFTKSLHLACKCSSQLTKSTLVAKSFPLMSDEFSVCLQCKPDINMVSFFFGNPDIRRDLHEGML